MQSNGGMRRIFLVKYVLLHKYGVTIMQTISATDLARNTREILDRVATGGESVVIQRNHMMIAQIIPPERSMTAAQALTGLSFPTLTKEQASAWLRDSKAGFDDTVHDPWA